MNPVNVPGNSPAVGTSYFATAWLAYFDNLTSVVNGASPISNPTFTGKVTTDTLVVNQNSTFTGPATFEAAQTFTGSAQFNGNVGFYGATPLPKPAITGSRTSGAALTNLLTQLTLLGLIVNETSS